MSGHVLVLLSLGLLLLGSAFFSASEIAILGVNRYLLERWAQQGRGGARALRELLERPEVALGALLVGITALNYTAEAVAYSWVIRSWGRGYTWVAIAGVTALVLVFSEITPITYAAANSDRVALWVARPVRAVAWVLALPMKLISSVARLLVWLTGTPARVLRLGPSAEELKTIVGLGAEGGVLEEEEKEMIHSIFEFGDTVAREVMVPRPDMVCVPETGTVQEAVRLTQEHRFSRLPVYRGDLDHICGVVHIKDLLPLVQAGRLETPVSEVMRAPLFVPETKQVSELLQEFRLRKQSLVIALDEYGGTAGLVTVEDLLEQIVGEIYDEYDVEQPAVEALGADSLLLDGRLSVVEASRLLGVELPEGDYDTIAGLLYHRLGVVPRQGQRVELDGVVLIVARLDGHRITRVQALKRRGPASAPMLSEGEVKPPGS